MEDLSSFIQNTLGTDGVRSDDCGIVYSRSRESTESIARQLCVRGIESKAYHAGLKVELSN